MNYFLAGNEGMRNIILILDRRESLSEGVSFRIRASLILKILQNLYFFSGFFSLQRLIGWSVGGTARSICHQVYFYIAATAIF